MYWLQKYCKESDGFPRPNWQAIYNHIDANCKEQDQHELWCDIGNAWIDQLKTKLPNNYQTHDSTNFILLTSETDRYASTYLKFLESTLIKIKYNLPGIANDDGDGKYVVLIFDDMDLYYSYLTYFNNGEGEFGQSSGIYINDGYGHFAFPHQDLSYAEVIAAHEMTHALLTHLPIPVWLNEGMAMTMENGLTGSSPLIIDNEIMTRHNSFWRKDEIQEFWQGTAFTRPDEGQHLSYHLAQFAVKTLTDDYEKFSQFVNKAHYTDGGETAAIEIYEGSLGGLVVPILGEDNWSPRPQLWKKL